MDKPNAIKRVYVAGHRGMVGSALTRQLKKLAGYEVVTRSRSELNLLDSREVANFFASESLDIVYLAAAKVGGIHANNEYPADFIYENLAIQNNVIHSAHGNNVQKLVFLGSSCIYPKYAVQPIAENSLLTGELEATNEPYAIAKIAGIKMCESFNRQFDRDYRSVMPTNLYGPGDNFHPEDSHVLPGLMQRMHKAKQTGAPTVEIWGSGRVSREFLHVEDMAAACIHIANVTKSEYRSHCSEMSSHVNVGTGVDHTIKEVAEAIKRIIGYQGELVFDTGKPDGTPRKLLDVTLIESMGWKHRIPLEEGLKITYDWFTENIETARNYSN